MLIDASAAYNQLAGIGRYSRNLIPRVIDQLPGQQWTLLRAPERTSIAWPGGAIAASVRQRTTPFSRKRADQLWFRLGIPLDVRLFAGTQDLVYSPDFTAPPLKGAPSVVTVHDLAFLTHPQYATPGLQRYLARVVPREVERADRVVAVSDATRDDLVTCLGVSPAKIDVVRNGVDDRFLGADPLTDLQRLRLGIPDRYVLMVGTIEPRKNHLTAFDTIQIINERVKVPLVVAGKPGWGFDEVLAQSADLEQGGVVIRLDHVAESDLPGLYASASSLLYPSWTEGFGLPVLESLAAGTPVVTGTAPALREVGGAFVHYMDPADPQGMADILLSIIEAPPDRHRRADLQRWAASFSWDDSAIALANVLRRYDRNST